MAAAMPSAHPFVAKKRKRKGPGRPIRGNPAKMIRGAASGGGAGPWANVGTITAAPRLVGRMRSKRRARTDSCGLRWLTAVRACAAAGRAGQRSLVWRQPPARAGGGDLGRGRVPFGLRIEEPEAGRARAGHAGDAGAGRAPPARRRSPGPGPAPAPRDRCARLPNRRADRGRRRPMPRTRPRWPAATPGLTSSTGVPGEARDLDGLDLVAFALAAGGPAEQAGGHVGAERGRDRPCLPLRAEQPQRRRRVGRAAADPGRDRQPLVEGQRDIIRAEPRARPAARDCRARPQGRRRTGRSPPASAPRLPPRVRTSPSSQKAKSVSIR